MTKTIQSYDQEVKAKLKSETDDIFIETCELTGFTAWQVKKYLREYTHKEIRAGLQTLYFARE